MKKKIMYFALVLAIAMLVAVEFGLNWLFVGIGFTLFCEYCYYTVYESNMPKTHYESKISFSREILLWHIAWCACTLALAGLFGLLGGYDLTEEMQTGNSFIYETVHQDGAAWWVLLVFLFARVAIQPHIEKVIRENIKLAGDYQ